MPGNGLGDRIHNFFGQENLSQSQHLPQVVEGAWPGLGNNFWLGSRRQIATPVISNLKNHNVPQTADSEGGHGSSNVHHGVNFSQSTLKPEFSRSRSQIQEATANGYMHGHQMFQTRQNEANVLGMDTESDGRSFTSRGFSVLDSQPRQGNGPEFYNKNSGLTDYTESPVNYDFFGGQQQITSQHSGMLQSLPRQQSGINDIHLLQQQFMLKQIQEVQRQQQLQKQQEGRQMTSFGKQAGGSHSSTSTLINGIPVQDVSNYSWKPELISANTNWLQQNVSPALQGSSSGHMSSAEQGPMPPLVGAVPQLVDQSLYGTPIGGSRVIPNRFSPMQIDKPTAQQISGSGNSFSGNQHTVFSDQVSVQDGNLAPGQGQQGKNMMMMIPVGQGLSSGFDLEHLQRSYPQQNNGPVQEFHMRQDLGSPSDISADKAVVQITPPQKVATLDPTEERILFGSDDNLWDAFGKGSGMASGGFNILDGMDNSGAFPSLQSGSWSALMQSAVAETSSDNIRAQEEWSGLTFLNNGATAKDHQDQIVNDVDKQQLTWADNRLQASALNSRPFPPSGMMDTNRNYNSLAGVQQLGVDTYEHTEVLQMGSSQRSIQQFPGEGTKWSQAEVSHDLGKVSYSSDAESNARTMSGSWVVDRSLPFYNVSGSQLSSRSNGLNFKDSALASAAGGLQNKANENTMVISHNNDRRSPMFDLMGHGASTSKTNFVSSSVVESEHVKSAVGSPQVNRESSDLNNIAAVPDSIAATAIQESSQQHAKSGNIDVWKHFNPSMTAKWSEISGKSEHDIGKSEHTFRSLRNNSLINGSIERHDMQNAHVKEKAAVGSQENDANDSCSLPLGRQKLFSLSGRKPSAGRKFQYHPMGDVDVDVETSYGTKDATHSQPLRQEVSQELKNHEQGYMNQSKISSHIARNSMETEKVHFSGLQGETRGSDETPVKSMHPGSGPITSAPLDEIVCSSAPDRTTSLSQNMLQLFDNMEQSREQGNAPLISSSDGDQSSQMLESRASQVPFHLQQNQSPAPQGFGLQLALSSQRFATHEHAFSSQRLLQAINHLRESHATVIGEKVHTWLAPGSSSVQSLPPPHDAGDSGQTESNSQGNVSATFFPGFPYSKDHVQNQHVSDTGGQATASQSVNVSYDKVSSESKQIKLSESPSSTPHDNVAFSNEMSHPSNHLRVPSPKFPVLEAAPVPWQNHVPARSQDDATSKGLPMVWTSVSARQQPFRAQPLKVSPDMFMSHLKSSKNSETTSSQQQSVEDQKTAMGSGVQSDSGPSLVTPLELAGKVQPGQGDDRQKINPGNDHSLRIINASQGKDPVANNLAPTTIPSAFSNQREIEAFSQSLKPNNALLQSFSSLQQVQGMKTAEVDPYNRTLKKFKGADGTVDAQSFTSQGEQQLYVHDKIAGDGLVDEKLIPPGESRMLSFSAKMTDGWTSNIPSNGTVPLGQNDCQNIAGSNNPTLIRAQHSQISPQMAPSWFDRYGTFKNGHILHPYDAQKMEIVKTTDLPFNVGRPSNRLDMQNSVERGNAIAATANHCVIAQKSSLPMSIASENFSSSQSMHHEAAGQNLMLERPKKRKSVTSGLVSWHKEVKYGLQKLQNISTAEVDWAKAVNRLTEKVEDEADMAEDIPPVLRLKRRLVLTTQLLQLLLRPPSVLVLFGDALSNYDSVTDLVARSTLGDACSILSCAEDNTCTPLNIGNHPHNQLKTSEKISDQYFLKVMEDLASRAKKVKNELLRLDKRMSVLDLRVECQDLERFSVINRFAKFHGRGQSDGAEASSSSDAPSNVQRYFPQRYVTALPMPRNLPDRVQCLSL